METRNSEEKAMTSSEETPEEDELDEEEEKQNDEDEAQEGCGAADLEDGDEEVGEDDGDVKRISKVKGTASDRKCVPGIIYLGHVPPRLRPKHVRNMLSVYGEIGRIFLQPEDRQVRARKKKSGLRRCDFTEGWVEFRDKRVAKRVAASLHNTPMATRKRQWIASDLWCMKYLHRFQWTHLSERLSYERSVLQQRLRTEISQAKRETNFYLENVDKSAHLERKRRRDGPQQGEGKSWDFTQHQTEEEIQSKKKRKKQEDKTRHMQQQSRSNVSLLAKIFNSAPAQ
ncbi:activator of basal transcription 1 isoform 1-T2 [Synchiropus picturatus]